jgi:hypothetical protein
MIAQVTPKAFDAIAFRYWIVWCCVDAAIVGLVYFFIPETRGRNLEEIDLIFMNSKTIFDPVRIARTLPKAHLAEQMEASAGKGQETNQKGGDTHEENI